MVIFVGLAAPTSVTPFSRCKSYRNKPTLDAFEMEHIAVIHPVGHRDWLTVTTNAGSSPASNREEKHFGQASAVPNSELHS